jgi:hypothetical protein
MVNGWNDQFDTLSKPQKPPMIKIKPKGRKNKKVKP